MKKLLIATAAYLLTVLPAFAQDRGMTVDKNSSNRRVALVIGNAGYKDAGLRNPVNDARDLSIALKEIGFEVTFKQDLQQREMKEAIRQFGERLRSADIGLFYYAGHGAQVSGRNYLIPIGAVINSEFEVEYESVDLGFVLAQMSNAANRTNIVILDACRNNPFARTFRSAAKGLASIDAPSGTLIAYATAPGSVASDGESTNGLYTQELLKSLKEPGLQVEQVFKRVRAAVQELTDGKQVPWESSSLIGDFYFKTAPEKPPASQRPDTAGRDTADTSQRSTTTDTRSNKPSGKSGIQATELSLYADDGKGNPGQRVSRFRPTDHRMHFEVAADGLKSGMKVRWVYTVVENSVERDFLITEVNYDVVDPSKRFLSSTLELPRDWLPGRYKVELFIDGELIKSLDYTVQQP